MENGLLNVHKLIQPKPDPTTNTQLLPVNLPLPLLCNTIVSPLGFIVVTCPPIGFSHVVKREKKEKLYSTTLHYTSYYTLHSKFFECTCYTLNYDLCYTLHSAIKFRVQNVIFPQKKKKK